MNVLKYFVIDEVEVYLSGGNGILKPTYKEKEIISTTAKALDKEYHKNEVAADLKYKNKYLFVTGIVNSINKGIGDNYYILFSGSENRFMQPHASMADGHQDYLANLNKGNKIGLLCKDSGMIIGSVTLRKCVPEAVSVTEVSTEYINNMQKYIDAGDKAPITLIAAADALTSLLPETSACYTGIKEKDCESDISKVFKTEASKKAMVEAAEKYGLPPIKAATKENSNKSQN